MVTKAIHMATRAKRTTTRIAAQTTPVNIIIVNCTQKISKLSSYKTNTVESEDTQRRNCCVVGYVTTFILIKLPKRTARQLTKEENRRKEEKEKQLNDNASHGGCGGRPLACPSVCLSFCWCVSSPARPRPLVRRKKNRNTKPRGTHCVHTYRLFLFLLLIFFFSTLSQFIYRIKKGDLRV